MGSNRTGSHEDLESRYFALKNDLMNFTKKPSCDSVAVATGSWDLLLQHQSKNMQASICMQPMHIFPYTRVTPRLLTFLMQCSAMLYGQFYLHCLSSDGKEKSQPLCTTDSFLQVFQSTFGGVLGFRGTNTVHRLTTLTPYVSKLTLKSLNNLVIVRHSWGRPLPTSYPWS